MASGNGHAPVLSQSELVRQASQAVALSPELRAATEASVIIQRMQFLRQAGITFGGQRDTYEIFGYDRLISNRQYIERYLRGGIAGSLVDVLPNATWRGSVEVLEDKDKQKDTEFETSWKELDVRLQVQAKLRRVDVLSQLTNYACLMIGAEGNLNEELPQAGSKKQEGIFFLTAFSGGGSPLQRSRQSVQALDADITVHEIELNPREPRFGLPKTYQLMRPDIAGIEGFQSIVHWSRVLHIAEGCLFDDINGPPSLERVWNLLDDLDKVTGGGAEAFFLRANQGLHIDIDKDMKLADTTAAIENLRGESEDYKHQLTRWIRTKGVKVETLGSDVANFQNPADAIITQIAGAKRIPKRILTGSEMGELASSQDRDNWKDQVDGRQTQYAGPYIVRPLVDRLIKYGYLPKPTKGERAYEVKWPHIQTLTEQERAEGAKAWAATNQTAGQTVFTTEGIRRKWYDLEPLTTEEVEADLELKEAGTPEPPPMAPGVATDSKPIAAPAEAERELLSVLEAAIEARNTDVVDRMLGIRVVEPKVLQLGVDYDYSSTQIQIPEPIATQVKQFAVASSDLAEKGREDDIHVTVKYGLHTSDPQEVREALADAGAVSFSLGKTDYFESDEYDVLFIQVRGRALHTLNKRVSSELEVTDTHPVYQPHVTIAYLKPGTAEKYAGREDFAGQKIEASELVFSPAKGERVNIPLSEVRS